MDLHLSGPRIVAASMIYRFSPLSPSDHPNHTHTSRDSHNIHCHVTWGCHSVRNEGLVKLIADRIQGGDHTYNNSTF